MVSEDTSAIRKARASALRKGRYVRPRSDSKLEFLPSERHDQLCDWLITPGMSYQKIVALVRKEWSINTHCDALAKFYQRHVAGYHITARRRTLSVVKELNKEIKDNPGNFTNTIVDGLEVRTQDAVYDPRASIRELNMLTDMCLRYRAQVLAEMKVNCRMREVAMMERREKRANETLRDSKLSPEEKFKNLREIFRK